MVTWARKVVTELERIAVWKLELDLVLASSCDWHQVAGPPLLLTLFLVGPWLLKLASSSITNTAGYKLFSITGGTYQVMLPASYLEVAIWLDVTLLLSHP